MLRFLVAIWAKKDILVFWPKTQDTLTCTCPGCSWSLPNSCWRSTPCPCCCCCPSTHRTAARCPHLSGLGPVWTGGLWGTQQSWTSKCETACLHRNMVFKTIFILLSHVHISSPPTLSTMMSREFLISSENSSLCRGSNTLPSSSKWTSPITSLNSSIPVIFHAGRVYCFHRCYLQPLLFHSSITLASFFQGLIYVRGAWKTCEHFAEAL